MSSTETTGSHNKMLLSSKTSRTAAIFITCNSLSSFLFYFVQSMQAEIKLNWKNHPNWVVFRQMVRFFHDAAWKYVKSSHKSCCHFSFYKQNFVVAVLSFENLLFKSTSDNGKRKRNVETCFGLQTRTVEANLGVETFPAAITIRNEWKLLVIVVGITFLPAILFLFHHNHSFLFIFFYH